VNPEPHMGWFSRPVRTKSGYVLPGGGFFETILNFVGSSISFYKRQILFGGALVSFVLFTRSQCGGQAVEGELEVFRPSS